MADYYRTNRADTLREADALHQALAEGRKPLVEEGVANEAMLKDSVDSLRGQFDPVNGGISGQQKFPHPGTMEWVMARYRRTREEGLRTIVTRTLTSMARGGVYDQIGGGFHRYSTDPRWIVPHFEKMLYDNAGLLANYVHAWQLTKDPIYRDAAEGILAWAEEVLSDRTRGGYYASQDADVGLDDDGDYFTWTLEELKAAVDPEEARVLVLFYEVGERGEMHHNPRKNVLFIDQEPEAIAKALGIPVDRVRDLLTSGRKKLKSVRDRRPMPAVDRTIFASWNGMMISAVLEAAMAFGRDDLRAFALKSLDRIRKEMWSKEHGMWHASADGKRKVLGLLEDHVYVVDALISFAGEAGRYGPVFAGTYHLAAELWIHPPPEIVILGPRTAPEVRSLQLAAAESFAPGKTVLIVDKEDAYMPALIEPMRKTTEAKAGPVAFVCQGNVCSQPTSAPERLRELLAGKGVAP